MTNIRNVKDMSLNPELIVFLEKLVAQAKEGSLRSMFCINSYDDNSTDNGWYLDKRTHLKPILAELFLAQTALATNMSLLDRDSALSMAIDGS